MVGRMDQTSTTIAAWLLSGATAEVVGGEPLLGEPISYWVDELEQAHPMEHDRKTYPGVVLTQPNGSRMLYATLSRQAAEELLERALQTLARAEHERLTS